MTDLMPGSGEDRPEDPLPQDDPNAPQEPQAPTTPATTDAPPDRDRRDDPPAEKHGKYSPRHRG